MRYSFKMIRKNKIRNLVIDIFYGVVLIVILWVVNTIIAFVPYDGQTNVRLVIGTWLLVDALIIFSLRRFINKIVVIAAVMIIIILVVLYLIPIRTNFPESALTTNERISSENPDKYTYAMVLFEETELKWTGPVRQYLLEPHKVFFRKSAAFFWDVDGYVSSNIQSQMYRNLLLESGRFNENEIEFKQHFCTNSPHGYVQINSDKHGLIYADHWAVDNFPGKERNEIYKFGLATFSPCNKLSGKEFIP